MLKNIEPSSLALHQTSIADNGCTVARILAVGLCFYRTVDLDRGNYR